MPDKCCTSEPPLPPQAPSSHLFTLQCPPHAVFQCTFPQTSYLQVGCHPHVGAGDLSCGLRILAARFLGIDMVLLCSIERTAREKPPGWVSHVHAWVTPGTSVGRDQDPQAAEDQSMFRSN
jgi:hypothetical protein